MSSPVAIQRDAFLGHLDRHLALARENDSNIGLVLIDINNLSKINHRHSYRLGDAILVSAFEALTGALTDPSNCFRIGAHTFAAILPDIKAPGWVVLAAGRLREVVINEIELDEHFTQPKAFLGVSMTHSEAIGGLNLLAKAEMHLAQTRRGRGFDLESMMDVEGEVLEAAQLERSFDMALLRNEFEVYYQPQIGLLTGEVIGAEALLRWNQTEQGFINPERIIQLAAQSGNSMELARSIINKVARSLAGWASYSDQFRIAINVSADLLKSNDLMTVLESATSIWGVSPRSLTIELTEQTLVDDFESDSRALHALVDQGYRIAIDDFGTGYSSLSYLKLIPAVELKIDQSFIASCLSGQKERELIRVIIELGQLFGMHVVAEGVEDTETRDTLRAFGCDVVQGYFIARPMTAQDFTEWLKDWRGWAAPE